MTPANLSLVDSEAPAATMTIEQLAAEAGVTVRNIRSHQGRGLLPPPEVRNRTGYYGEEHLRRLRAIRELQADGFNLRGIKRLFERNEIAEGLLDVKRAVTEPFGDEQPEVFTDEDLRRRFGIEESERESLMRRATKLGALVSLGEGRYEAPSPALLAAADEVVALGVPLAEAIEVLANTQRHAESVARRFIRLFIDNVWQPFEAAGMPEQDLPKVLESIEQLRPLAARALLATFQQTMTSQVEESFEQTTRRIAKDRH